MLFIAFNFLLIVSAIYSINTNYFQENKVLINTSKWQVITDTIITTLIVSSSIMSI